MNAATTILATALLWTMGKRVSVFRAYPIPCCANGSVLQCCQWTESWKLPCITGWLQSGVLCAAACFSLAPIGRNTARTVPVTSSESKPLNANESNGGNVTL